MKYTTNIWNSKTWYLNTLDSSIIKYLTTISTISKNTKKKIINKYKTKFNIDTHLKID